MKFFTALAGLFLIIGIVLSLIAGVLKIFILGRFKMDQEWFDFGPSFNDLKLVWRRKKGVKNAFLRAAYSFFSLLGSTLVYLGFISFFIIYLKG